MPITWRSKEALTFKLGLICEELVLILLAALRHSPQQQGVLLVLTQGREPLTTLTQLRSPNYQHSHVTHKCTDDFSCVLQVILGQRCEVCCSSTLESAHLTTFPPGGKDPVEGSEGSEAGLGHCEVAGLTLLRCPSRLCVSAEPFSTRSPPSSSCTHQTTHDPHTMQTHSHRNSQVNPLLQSLTLPHMVPTERREESLMPLASR